MSDAPDLDAASPDAVATASGDRAAPEAADVAALREALGEGLLATGDPLGQVTALVAADRLLDALRLLQDRGYGLLRSVTAVDFLPREPRFHVVYHLLALPGGMLAGDATRDPADPPRALRLKVPLAGEAPVVPSATPLYPTAEWLEREVYDLFGIEFAGHPDPRRILMPDDYAGHPLRKDHPLVYEEVAFTFNAARVAATKPKATS